MTNKKRMWSEDEIEHIANERAVLVKYKHEKRSFAHDRYLSFWLCVILVIMAITIMILWNNTFNNPTPTTDQILSEASWTKECVEWNYEDWWYSCNSRCGDINDAPLYKEVSHCIDICNKITRKNKCTKHTWLLPGGRK